MTDEHVRPEFLKRNGLLLRATAAAIIALAAKGAMHALLWEVVPVNPLFAGIVAADVFLMSFLLSGVWSDYKESEKLPGELASNLEALADEAISIGAGKYAARGTTILDALSDLSITIDEWFYKKKQTDQLMQKLEHLNVLFVGLDPVVPANFVARMKQDLASIRRVVTRIRTIRATEFVSGGYLIAQVTTAFVVLALILAKIEPFHESVFFVGVITFLLTFMILLIEDLDNPFGYYEKRSTQDVSLYPVEEISARLRRLCADARSSEAVRAVEGESRHE